MQSGGYGSIDSSIVENYRLQCNRLWPQANLFQLNPTSTFDQNLQLTGENQANLSEITSPK